jgi:hypothetical protein
MGQTLDCVWIFPSVDNDALTIEAGRRGPEYEKKVKSIKV